MLRLEFSPDLDLGDLANLVAAEQHCCAFFSFAITIDHRGVGLEIHTPSGSEQLAADLFGPLAA